MVQQHHLQAVHIARRPSRCRRTHKHHADRVRSDGSRTRARQVATVLSERRRGLSAGVRRRRRRAPDSNFAPLVPRAEISHSAVAAARFRVALEADLARRCRHPSFDRGRHGRTNAQRLVQRFIGRDRPRRHSWGTMSGSARCGRPERSGAEFVRPALASRHLIAFKPRTSRGGLVGQQEVTSAGPNGRRPSGPEQTGA